MVWLADFHLDMRGQPGGQPEAGTENFEDQRVAALDEFDAAAEADAEGFEALHLFIVGLDVADDRADPRRELIQPDKLESGLACGCHSDSKISWPEEKSMNPAAGRLRNAVGELRRAPPRRPHAKGAQGAKVFHVAHHLCELCELCVRQNLTPNIFTFG